MSVNTPEFYEYNQRAKTQEFLEKYKERSCREWKNGDEEISWIKSCRGTTSCSQN